MDTGIRPARPDELDAVAALSARAFAAEPFMNWVAGGDPERLRRFARLAVHRIRRFPDLARSTGVRRLPAVLRGLIRLERAHPGEPHGTLLTLGVEPARQSTGRGSAMLRALAARSAAPLYLETSSPRNVALYERHGYAVLRELSLPSGPPVWTMLAR
jgi:ribosomal protein S18 acetylase RimI-like enzyme